MSDRPAPRKSGRAPKGETLWEPLDPLTVDALQAMVFLQNERGVPDRGSKSQHLSRIVSDLELACVVKKPADEVERLCLDVAALALRILEQGD